MRWIGNGAAMPAKALGPVVALALAGAIASPASAQSRLDRIIDACRDYAGAAVRANRINRRRNCGLSGPRWSSDPVGHFRWCVSVPPPARQREAAARRAELRNCRGRGPGPRPGACTREYRPVCGVRDGERNTYSNACEARRARARIVHQGQCRNRPPNRGPGRACALRDARLSVSSPGCSPQSLRLDFGRRRLGHGQAVTKTLNSGTIGKGHGPWGVCNFHSRIRYVCRDGRLRIQRIFVCQQARTNRTAATCRVSN